MLKYLPTMKYAVLRINGKQYKVEEGKEFLAHKIEGKPEAELLLVSDGEKVLLGTPAIAKADVKLKVISQEEKGEKVDVYKYKAKARYRKHTGFRPVYTRLLVEKISL